MKKTLCLLLSVFILLGALLLVSIAAGTTAGNDGEKKQDPITITESHIHEVRKEEMVGFRDGQYVFRGQCSVCGAEVVKGYDAVVTFVDDDAKTDALLHWEKIIDSTGVRMNSALITGKPKEKTPSNPYSFAGWDLINRLKEKGVEFVCHTNGHIKLTEKTSEEIHADLKLAKSIMQEHGLNDEILVYPFLAYNDRTISIVSQYFSMGVGGLRWMNEPETDPYRISRISINDITIQKKHEFNNQAIMSYTIKSQEKLRQPLTEAIETHSWLVYKSHAYNSVRNYWFDEEDEQTIIELIKYIQSLPNVKIITLSEAYPILDTNATDHRQSPPKIIRQPQDINVACTASAVTTEAFVDGENLTYQWYVKNPGNQDFVRKESMTHDWYSVKTDKNTDGRQVYCVATDAYGNSVQTETVTITLAHNWDGGKVTKEATGTSEGELTFTCSGCGAVKTDPIPPKTPATPTKTERLPGDVDSDGELTSADARLALRASVKLETILPGSPAFLAADADRNGAIESADARLILRASVKLETL